MCIFVGEKRDDAEMVVFVLFLRFKFDGFLGNDISASLLRRPRGRL